MGYKTSVKSRVATLNISSQDSGPMLMFQVPNEVGMGHMNRMACIAIAMREMDPAVRPLFVVEGSSHGLLESYSLPYVSIPSTQMMRSMMSWTKFSQNEKEAISHTIGVALLDTLKPDLVAYDCFPNLAFAMAAAKRKVPSVLCIRNMKDYCAYLTDTRVSLVLNSCESILVPHALEDSVLPAELLNRALHVGSIVRQLPVDPVPVQLRLNLHGKRVIVISAGGGGHPDTVVFLRLCLEAFDILHGRMPDLAAVLIPGPLFHSWDQLPLTSNVCVLPFDPLFLDTCATADAILAQAGYNSANELALLGTPTIMVPARRGFDDQFGRADQMAARWPQVHSLPAATLEGLVSILEKILIERIPRMRQEVPEGAYRAAAHMLHMLHRLG